MEESLVVSILQVGAIIILTIGIKHFGEKIGIPSLVGYIVLGLVFQYFLARVSASWSHDIFAFLAELGIIVLLFKVGLESNLSEMIAQLPKAALIWLGNILVSGGLGFWASYSFLGWELIPSMFIAIALTATSVGISVAAWQEAGVINSRSGALMLDIAELDDISGVVFMAMLFAIAPVLQTNAAETSGVLLLEILGLSLLKLTVFGVACYLIAQYVEEPVTSFFQRLHGDQDALLIVLGMGLIVASIAGLLGFSVAIGAFFAGLIFSKDPQRVKIDTSFDSIHGLFAPFFFVGIGLQLDISALGAIGTPVLVLLAVAITGKLLGTFFPARLTIDTPRSLLLGVSMIPRAEIALIIMQTGLLLGEWAVPPAVFANMIAVCAATTLIAPFVLRPMFKMWPQSSFDI